MKKIKKYHKKLRKYVKRYPARSAGYFTTFTMIVKQMYTFTSLPLLIFLGALIIGIGESAQRAEDKKTISAIYLENEANTPDEELIKRLSE